MGTQIDSTFDTLQMRAELTAFLTVVATIYAKQLTRQAHESLDNTLTGVLSQKGDGLGKETD